MNTLLYKHWRKTSTAKQELQELVHWTIVEQKAKPVKGKVKVTITAHFKGAAKHDPDNLFVKPILDAVTEAGILPDDNCEIIRQLTLVAENRAKEDKIVIEIEAIKQ